ncbi:MAG: beta-glucosidase BglX [Prevotella sp.]|nr:beta-glucosidase BglX [Prevotella sp.]
MSSQKDLTLEEQRSAFIRYLMEQMTIEEKIGQLNLIDAGNINTGIGQKGVEQEDLKAGQVGAYLSLLKADRIRAVQQYAVEQSRLGIPLLFGFDVIHGYRTIFPIPLALSCTWDMAAVERCARIAATEAAADGICWVYSPMVDIARDARWGRIAESAGEDPYMGSRMAEAYVIGYQGKKVPGDRFSTDEVMSCMKHFGLYGASESGLDYNVTDMSRVRMYNDYLPPYHAAVKAGTGSIMSSFNTIDYVPATLSKWLLTDLLRDQWNFDGFVVTDWGSIKEACSWGCGDLQETSSRALKAGTDMDMCSRGFISTLLQSLHEGKVTEADINRACRRILEAKWDLGLFEDPYRYCDISNRKEITYTQESRTFARKVATESFVLLKNEGDLLPLQKKGKIALIGPMADGRENMLGMWSPSADRSIQYSTLLDGMRKAVGEQAEVLYAKGSNIYESEKIEKHTAFNNTDIRDSRSEQTLLDEALQVAAQADIIVAAIGESQEMSGESSSRVDLNLPDTQMRLLRALYATGKPIVAVYFTGRPVVMTWEKEHLPAILNVWFGGSESGEAICDVLFGDVNPSGKLTTSFPRATGQEPFYYNRLNTGRAVSSKEWFKKYVLNYLDIPSDAVFPFGYGLSYTTFSYGRLTLDKETITADGKVTASVTVTNTGRRDGDEIVQLYLNDPAASIARPVKELKGFHRIHLHAGESKVVSFEINEEMLRFYNSNLEYVSEPGEFNVMVGPNSEQVQTVKLVLVKS